MGKLTRRYEAMNITRERAVDTPNLTVAGSVAGIPNSAAPIVQIIDLATAAESAGTTDPCGYEPPAPLLLEALSRSPRQTRS